MPEVAVPQREHEPLEIAERILTNMPDIGYGRTLASYSPSMDTISMPCPEWFESREEFYGALWHECAHGTEESHSSGLDCPPSRNYLQGIDVPLAGQP
ncbi:zincin-like metallopeptidase domain-containing protein [Pontiella agarivorans]|uniref:Zincin-like metallopeptidase domain-containing protein n=1 Tax=Pontiella agarivorans TaxID=3038953 RepID=A0ABU5N1G4_9BACT|nr:zincin-like metallopeptidase domain-containing protein [Pontiella agarivorans]MDZ8120258.1 zincin-like metallopeptidase domain-containing protein [Pontiella agarivorans]